MKSPKQQQPTTEEKVMRQRQVEDIARLDDEENTRIKRLTRGRLGSGSLLAGRRSSTAGAGAAGAGGGGGGGSAGAASASGAARGSVVRRSQYAVTP